jgi:hypothetical protein
VTLLAANLKLDDRTYFSLDNKNLDRSLNESGLRDPPRRQMAARVLHCQVSSASRLASYAPWRPEHSVLCESLLPFVTFARSIVHQFRNESFRNNALGFKFLLSNLMATFPLYFTPCSISFKTKQGC